MRDQQRHLDTVSDALQRCDVASAISDVDMALRQWVQEILRITENFLGFSKTFLGHFKTFLGFSKKFLGHSKHFFGIAKKYLGIFARIAE